VDGTSTWDLPLSLSYFLSYFSSGTRNPERLFCAGMGVGGDAKSVFDGFLDRLCRSVCGLGGAGAGQEGPRAVVHRADHRPVPRMAKRVQPEDLPRRETGGLRRAENQLGGKCVRTEFVDWGGRERRNPRADNGKEVQHESGVVAGWQMDRVSL